ncbi:MULTISPECIES: hypothetical protein [unclassified Paenibacillus]|uniref:hypothetical protein n=1 Tax=unclassified Paenibacillus TaxID=185978 RepID=UPI00384B8EF9
MEPQKDPVLSTEEKSINLKAIFDDSNESVQVRSAAITAMRRLNEFKGNTEEIGRYSLLRNLNTISSMLKSQSDDKIITALKASEIINYGEAYPGIKEIRKNSKNSEVIKAAEHALETIIPENLVDEFNTKKWEGR